MRKGLTLAVIAVLAPACGGGGGSDADPAPSTNSWWATITTPVEGAPSVGYASAPGAPTVRMSGQTFVSPTWWGIGGSGGDAGVTVTWVNQTTGESGPASTHAVVTFYGFFGSAITGNDWSAFVPVAPGLNHVVVTASDPSGRTGTASVDFTPRPLAAISPGVAGAYWGITGDPGDPFNQMTQDSRTQFVVLASELTAAGIPAGASLRELHLHCTMNQNALLRNLRIRLRESSSATLAAFETSGWTLVSGPLSTTPTSGNWIPFGFDTPFVWNGADNLLIELSRDEAATGAVGGLYVQTGVAMRMVAAGQDSVSDWPFDTGLAPVVENAIPELRLGW